MFMYLHIPHKETGIISVYSYNKRKAAKTGPYPMHVTPISQNLAIILTELMPTPCLFAKYR